MSGEIMIEPEEQELFDSRLAVGVVWRVRARTGLVDSESDIRDGKGRGDYRAKLFTGQRITASGQEPATRNQASGSM